MFQGVVWREKPTWPLLTAYYDHFKSMNQDRRAEWPRFKDQTVQTYAGRRLQWFLKSTKHAPLHVRQHYIIQSFKHRLGHDICFSGYNGTDDFLNTFYTRITNFARAKMFKFKRINYQYKIGDQQLCRSKPSSSLSRSLTFRLTVFV